MNGRAIRDTDLIKCRDLFAREKHLLKMWPLCVADECVFNFQKVFAYFVYRIRVNKKISYFVVFTKLSTHCVRLNSFATR